MASGRMIAATLIAMTVVAVLVGPLATSATDNTGVVGVNEEISADSGTWQDLEGFDLTSNFSAETSSGGTSLSEGSDYELNESAGTIKFLSGSANVNDGDAVTTTYEYNATDSTTSVIAGLLPLFAGLLLLGTAAMRIRQMM